MKKSLIGMTILIIVTLFCFSPTFGSSEKVDWQTYEEGMAIGKEKAKKVFIYFWAGWCGYCKRMDAITFNDPGVISVLNQHFIPVRVNLDKEKNVARGYNVRGVPVSWFISETGEKIASKAGYAPPKSLLPALKFIYTDSYKQMSFKDFLKDQ
jgi:thioredoxin-related protein